MNKRTVSLSPPFSNLSHLTNMDMDTGRPFENPQRGSFFDIPASDPFSYLAMQNERDTLLANGITPQGGRSGFLVNVYDPASNHVHTFPLESLPYSPPPVTVNCEMIENDAAHIIDWPPSPDPVHLESPQKPATSRTVLKSPQQSEATILCQLPNVDGNGVCGRAIKAARGSIWQHRRDYHKNINIPDGEDKILCGWLCEVGGRQDTSLPCSERVSPRCTLQQLCCPSCDQALPGFTSGRLDSLAKHFNKHPQCREQASEGATELEE
ncbi:hypothetical protein BKA70DRAFT_1344969 [Coprinopsis sp. MPI-PUGE-AT-0042]|nr:hypothetical protein BKA70DRAFT_1344969 [Coprinopsis sp. MPI-PUGE-AT-0042]